MLKVNQVLKIIMNYKITLKITLKIAYKDYRINYKINIFRFACERRTAKYADDFCRL